MYQYPVHVPVQGAFIDHWACPPPHRVADRWPTWRQNNNWSNENAFMKEFSPFQINFAFMSISNIFCLHDHFLTNCHFTLMSVGQSHWSCTLPVPVPCTLYQYPVPIISTLYPVSVTSGSCWSPSKRYHTQGTIYMKAKLKFCILVGHVGNLNMPSWRHFHHFSRQFCLLP